MKKITLLFILFVFTSGSIFSQSNGDNIFVENLGGTDYVIHAFTTTGTSTFTPPSGITSVDVLIVAGGGGGAGHTPYNSAGGGAGGAGGLIYETNYTVAPGSPFSLTVGDGGNGRDGINTPADNGENSVFDGLTALGGGGGNITPNGPGPAAASGGSGGGGRQNPAGLALQPGSADGGFGNDGARNSNDDGGGGGGGAGTAPSNITGPDGGNGGNGRNYSGFFGSSYGEAGFFAGGGGGGGDAAGAQGLGGTGGGGDGSSARDLIAPDSGMPNTGGGGGGGSSAHPGASGGSGIILVRYRLSDVTDFFFVNDGLWNVNTNWSNNTLPPSGADVTIAANPQVSNAQSVNNIEVFAGVQIDIDTGVNLSVSGDINSFGDFIGDGEVILDGTSAQTISGGGAFENLRLDNPTSVGVSDPTDLFGVLNIDQGDFNSNGNLFLRCDFTSAKTAQVGPVAPGSSINGDVTVEQCFPERRAFRFISPSVTSTTSIRENWQEDPVDYLDDPRPGYGTHITGVEPGAANATLAQDGDNGFDYSPSGNVSMFTFDNINAVWNEIGNTNDPLVAGAAYRLMIRGNRSVDITDNGSAISNTVLSSVGALDVGNRSFTNLSSTAGAFNFIGNPYQAQVNINTLLTSPSTTNVSTSEYYVWDPTLGGSPTVGSPGGRGAYVTVDPSDGSNSFDTSIGGLPTSTANQYLQPMQAAFVRTLANASASITFQESMKAVDQTQTEVKSLPSSEYINIQLFNAESYAEGSTPSDGLRIKFDKAYSLTPSDDSPKLGNLDENLARVEDNVYSAIERRPFPEVEEELELFINQYRREAYVMKFDLTDNLNTKVYIKDSYLNELTEITSSAHTYAFTVDSSIPESVATDRFSLVFEPESLSTVEESLSTLSLYPNPTQGKFSVGGRALEQGSELEIYNMLGQQVYKRTLQGQANVEVTDFNANAGLYLVKLTTNQGEKTFKLIKE